MWKPIVGAASLVMVLALPSAARAQATGDEPELVEEPAGDQPASTKEKKRKGRPDQLRFGGRVYVRDTLSGVAVGDDTTWLEERTIDSARAFLSFRPNRRTRMDIEVDFAKGQAGVKDTFIRFEPFAFLELTAGRFKRPVSFIGLESSWSLPRIDRGLLSALRFSDGSRLLFAGGRGDGLALHFDPGGAMRPELTIVMHQSEVADGLGLEITEAVNQDLFARFEFEPVEGLHLAMAGGWIGTLTRLAGDPDSYAHRPFGTLEAFLETSSLRVWLEAMAGLNANAYVGNEQSGRFVAAQTLVAPRLELPGSLRAIEPYGAFAWYEPSTDQSDDQFTEVTGGASLWISGKLRLQLEGGRRFAQDAAAAADATIIRIQLGAAFKSKTILD
ncbi:MAG TPA: hypothetical protein VML75_06225 [Kofleriaceae bacterium]|nr:hypothetical protein [Kofleriaceae bacterium]